jgi:hypothetical protein
MVDVDIGTSLGRPLEGSQALQRLPIRKTDDLIIPLEDEQFVGGAGPSMRAAMSATVGTSISRLIAVVWT